MSVIQFEGKAKRIWATELARNYLILVGVDERWHTVNPEDALDWVKRFILKRFTYNDVKRLHLNPEEAVDVIAARLDADTRR